MNGTARRKRENTGYRKDGAITSTTQSFQSSKVSASTAPSTFIRSKRKMAVRLKFLIYVCGLLGLQQGLHYMLGYRDLDDIPSFISDGSFASSSLFLQYSLRETFPVSSANLTTMKDSLGTVVTKHSHKRIWNRFLQQLPDGTDERGNVTAPMISIVVRLRGEMANHMSCIAHARGIQLYALETLGLETKLVFLPQYDIQQGPQGAGQLKTSASTTSTTSTILMNPKGDPTRKSLNQCFPSIQRWNIINYDNAKTEKSLIRPEAFLKRKQEQADLLRGWSMKDVQGVGVIVTKTENITSTPPLETDAPEVPLKRVLDWINGRRPPRKGLRKPLFSDNLRLPVQETDLKRSIQAIRQLALEWKLHRLNSTNYYRILESTTNTVSDEGLIALPFFDSNSLDIWWFIDRYYDDFRALFSFWSHESISAFGVDDSSCCAQVPHPDESVFHFRNFESEMTQLSSVLGFDDVTPNQTASLLFGHLQAGDRVAIAARQYKNSILSQHVEALRQRGILVRVISTSDNDRKSGVLDFCFLAHAQKEFIGNVRSTYAVWAALLGNAHKVQLYTVDSPGLRMRFFQGTDGPRSGELDGNGDNRRHFDFPWSNPQLKSRIQFRWIPYDMNRSRKGG